MTPEVSRKRRSQSGAALPAALIACLVVGTAAGLAMTQSLFRYKLTINSLNGEQAEAAAEGGAEIAVARIADAAALGSSVSQSGTGTIGKAGYSYEIIGDRVRSTATVGKATRTVSVYGVSKGYWCKYAYFANYFNTPNANGTPGSSIWLITGDRIKGQTHCNNNIYIAGSPVFEGDVSLVGNIVLSAGTANNPSYSNGTPKKVSAISLSSIDFSVLKSHAQSGGIVIQGSANILCSGTQMVITTSTSTNTFIIGKNDNNVIYASNGLLANPGAGSWQGQIVTNSVMEWTPTAYTVTTNAGYYGAGISQGGGSCPAMYTDTAYSPNVQYAWNWNGHSFQYRSWNGSSWSSYSTCYNDTYTSTWVPETVYSDYKTTGHYEFYARRKQKSTPTLAYLNPYTKYPWIPPTVVTNTISSNLVSVSSNYVEQTWVFATNANLAALGDIKISGVLSRGLTVVAEHNITVTNDLVYTNDADGGYAYTNPASDVMCALISGADVIVANSSPSTMNVPRKIHASIMATGTKTGSAEGDPNGIDGRFYVENYSSGKYKGVLTVYGGIVQNWRGCVGTFSGVTPSTGYTKDYIYDVRYGPAYGKAPPSCPLIDVRFIFTRWANNTID